LSDPAPDKATESVWLLLQMLRDCATATVLIDPDGHVAFANAAFARIVGREERDLPGRPLQELLELGDTFALPPARADEWVTAVIFGRAPRLARVRKADRPAQTLVCTTQPLLTSRGELLGMLLFIQAQPVENVDLASVLLHAGNELQVVGQLLRELRGLGAWRHAPGAFPPAQVLERLSRREAEVLRELSRGLTPAAVAAELHISLSTVRNHIRSIYAKLGVRSQLELLAQLFQT
jgi:DNA-binding CsgD family transcriptional regulator